MRHVLSLAARFGLAAACLGYALWGVDFSRLWQVLAELRVRDMLLYALAVLASTVLPGLRLRFLTGNHITPATGLQACLLGLGVNNVLPARLGEMAKAMYLRREASLSLGQALEAVFWERFFDLSALLCLGVAVAALLGQSLILYPLLALVGGGWAFLGLLRLRPGAAHACLKLVPGERLRLFAGEMLGLLEARLRADFLLRLAGWTALTWVGFVGTCGLGLCLLAGFPFDATLVLTVFAVITLGFALPAAPGGMGVYEASAVLALGWFGVDRERAFAVGLALHMLQYLPVTLAGLWVLAASGLSLADLRRRAEAPGL
jgi:uncharacterized membrane protein YbhN (UPF0104 family)